MKWSDVAAAAPELTATGEFALTRNGLCIVATLRADGSPRVSFVEATFVDGHLLLAMMRRSAKALDLLRDPRISVHNAVCTNLGTEQEYKVRGRATEVSDPVLRQHFVAIRGRVWGNRRFHLFAVDLESCGNGHLCRRRAARDGVAEREAGGSALLNLGDRAGVEGLVGRRGNEPPQPKAADLLLRCS